MKTIATVNIYEWHRELGTHVFSTLGLGSLGQYLGVRSADTQREWLRPRGI